MSNTEYEKKLREKDEEIARKDKRIAELEQLLAMALDRIAELERRLGLNSGNSSKPPSSDGFRKKPAPKSLRCSGQNSSGGQKGHRGHTLEASETVDHVVTHAVKVCESCQGSLADIPVERMVRRQVFDIPEPKIEVTQHEAQVKICPCGCVNTGLFPQGINAPVQYGKRVAALAVYLSVQQMIPEDRLQEAFWDIFSLKISTATLAGLNEAFSQKITSCVEESLASLKTCDVKHLDETGIRIGSKTQWLHVISNLKDTHYRVSLKRGHLLNDIRGTVVHDHWKPYFKLPDVTHALCNAHHLRELKALQEEKENWAFELFDLLKTISHEVSLPIPPTKQTIRKYTKRYDKILAKGFLLHESLPPLQKHRSRRGRLKRRTGHNLLIRLRDFKDDVLRCLLNPAVPFSNNQAERDIRMMKVKLKISGCFRSQRGAEIFCSIRSFLSSKRKQNQNLFTSIFAAYA